MSSPLPEPLTTLVKASELNDMDLFLSAWADDALLCDSHRQFWGKEAIRRWCSIEWTGDQVTIDEIKAVDEIHGQHIVHMVLNGTDEKEGLPEEFLVAFLTTIRDDRIVRMVILPHGGRRLGQLTQTRVASTCFSAPVPALEVDTASVACIPPEIAALLTAIASGDADAVVAAFTPDAYVNDKHRALHGHAAIRRWVEAEIVGKALTFEPLKVTEHYGETIVTARLTGGYDRDAWDTFITNNAVIAQNGPAHELPVTLWVTLHDGAIGQLIITPTDGAPPIRTEQASALRPAALRRAAGAGSSTTGCLVGHEYMTRAFTSGSSPFSPGELIITGDNGHASCKGDASRPTGASTKRSYLDPEPHGIRPIDDVSPRTFRRLPAYAAASRHKRVTGQPLISC
ncbi:nuclear transport factor 2 family protein [Streptomyces sp. NPDC005708]|uniref:nuclear transport factor 2 family protein n=1 Tax=Streptomyces sp. NPDC005708 TaxID=3154564 RepID=UPI0033D77FD2